MSRPYIIVPVFNGSSPLNNFMTRINDSWLDRLVFVDDGSSDDTLEKLKNLNVTFLQHSKNLGKGAAIQTAMDWILQKGGDRAVTMDIDLQHPPELLNNFSQIPEKTILLGYRNNRRNMPLARQFSNFITSLLVSIRSCSVIKDSQCGYRSFQTNIFSDIQCVEHGFQFESEFLIKASIAGWKVQHVTIPTIYSNEPSAMRNVRDTVKFVNMWLRSFFWT
ncbi:MAG: glycosyltransferase family 2 protein [Candidatus Marinimicrobia bacterium]|nr:glycosyltransferase family 2 protein [Candidatus Neomarinimicrobiota bacterium]